MAPSVEMQHPSGSGTLSRFQTKPNFDTAPQRQARGREFQTKPNFPSAAPSPPEFRTKPNFGAEPGASRARKIPNKANSSAASRQAQDSNANPGTQNKLSLLQDKLKLVPRGAL
jgi:hypothetical protein